MSEVHESQYIYANISVYLQILIVCPDLDEYAQILNVNTRILMLAYIYIA